MHFDLEGELFDFSVPEDRQRFLARSKPKQYFIESLNTSRKLKWESFIDNGIKINVAAFKLDEADEDIYAIVISEREATLASKREVKLAEVGFTKNGSYEKSPANDQQSKIFSIVINGLIEFTSLVDVDYVALGVRHISNESIEDFNSRKRLYQSLANRLGSSYGFAWSPPGWLKVPNEIDYKLLGKKPIIKTDMIEFAKMLNSFGKQLVYDTETIMKKRKIIPTIEESEKPQMITLKEFLSSFDDFPD